MNPANCRPLPLTISWVRGSLWSHGREGRHHWVRGSPWSHGREGRHHRRHDVITGWHGRCLCRYKDEHTHPGGTCTPSKSTCREAINLAALRPPLGALAASIRSTCEYVLYIHVHRHTLARVQTDRNDMQTHRDAQSCAHIDIQSVYTET